MTGYGCAEAVFPGGKVIVEIKAVNHRFCDVMVRLPRAYMCFEDSLRKLVQENVARGRVEAYITIEEIAGKNVAVQIDKELAIAYHKALEDLCRCLGMKESVSLESIIAQPGVMNLVETRGDINRMLPVLQTATKEALAQLIRRREAEGASLVKDIKDRLGRIKGICMLIEEEAPRVVQSYRERILERLGGLSDLVEPGRVLGEAALLAERADITEELVRLRGHTERIEETLVSESAAGRRLDFLLQEMFREFNTIVSKAQNLRISQLVIDAKSELEKMREQAQNLE
ncbi:MAG TPA: YicC family protein [Desulfotomaculum sp.]|nr:YicC family protein [Desulfotomaculum sp.]